MKLPAATVLALACAIAPSLPLPAAADQIEPLGPVPSAARARFDLAEVKGLLAVQRLDGWLLYDFEGQNPIAGQIVGPSGLVNRRWFYLIPAKGEPIALVHKVESSAFAHVPGKKLEYADWRELEAGLKHLAKGRRKLAMEYAPGGTLPSFSRVDAGTIELVRAQGVEVVSSAELVQAVKSRWGRQGRASHHVAVHHLVALKDDALAFVADRVRGGQKVTEYDVEQRIRRGYQVRGLVADHPPIVAAGPNTANPHYLPTAETAREIREGDLLLLELVARVDGDPLAIHADLTWVAYVGAQVPDEPARAFATVARARDETIAFLADRMKQRRPVRGFEADRVARGVIEKAGFGDRFIHRTGHSIDTRAHGDGANLDDFETRDTRTLIQGTGFTIEPGVYFPGTFGVRAGVVGHHGPSGLEVTTPVQDAITPILKR